MFVALKFKKLIFIIFLQKEYKKKLFDLLYEKFPLIKCIIILL